MQRASGSGTHGGGWTSLWWSFTGVDSLAGQSASEMQTPPSNTGLSRGHSQRASQTATHIGAGWPHVLTHGEPQSFHTCPFEHTAVVLYASKAFQSRASSSCKAEP